MRMISIFILSLGLLISPLAYTAHKSASKSANSSPTTSSSISLYEKPDAKSKVVETITSSQTLIPIFSEGDWTKVGNPNNGNVGWISNKVLTEYGIPQVYVKTFARKNKGDAYQIVQFSSTRITDEKKYDSFMKNIQEQHTNLQKSFDQLMDQSVKNFKTITQDLEEIYGIGPAGANKAPAPPTVQTIAVPGQTK